MAQERTLSIVKPDSVGKNNIGSILDLLEKSGLKIVAAKMMHLKKDQAERFYLVHKERPFYNDLVNFMTTGPVLVMVLEGDNAVMKNREVMGATDPKKAVAGTIRYSFGASIEENSVHGSDSKETAQQEIAFFFKPEEILNRTR